ncbi:Dehydrogenase/reductase SDR family member 12 [Pteropus alecto]|uniref:Dehydrogenase/reductase SDR family member 12 n=1 Tax=Pteropus alecto TaxID=9402 RepID=L5KVJ7_PTEAL|nr:Dehydrogenase/reductase SDR family member 12 [Pteropus alecto]
MPPQSQAFSLHGLVFPAPYSHSFCVSAASRTGYESACEDFVPDDLEVQVAGRAFLVTGGKSGIGKATAIEIAKRGGTVHLVCRDKDGVQGAKGEIIRESGNQINNAGCMVNKSKLTEDGLEKNFATNTLDMYMQLSYWKSAATPLSLARTPSSPAEEEKLSEILEELAQRFK